MLKNKFWWFVEVYCCKHADVNKTNVEISSLIKHNSVCVYVRSPHSTKENTEMPIIVTVTGREIMANY